MIKYPAIILQEFKQILTAKLQKANEQLLYLRDIVSKKSDNGTDDTRNSLKLMEDVSDTSSKEEAGYLAAKQEDLIRKYTHALIRIENKNYGICTITGEQIPIERLKACPEAMTKIII